MAVNEPIRLALLGDPVAHSRSPAIHAAALAQSGLKGEYRAIRADRAALERAVAELRSGALTGMNVTMPLKAVAVELADVLTPQARASESVNSLREAVGLVEAHSTDAVAFEELFDDERFSGAPLLVLGSGSTARAALAVVDPNRAQVSARSADKAEELSTKYGLSGSIPWGEAVPGSVIVNATSLGMRGEDLPQAVLTPAAGLIDLPYGARPTAASAGAAARGLPLADGVEFLARQARASFFWWTGEAVDLAGLVEAARNV